jgi:hypothetical protein
VTIVAQAPDSAQHVAGDPLALGMAKTKSGSSWVQWANAHALASHSVEDLAEPFRSHVKAFIKALTDAGAKVTVNETRRSDRRAYLFHWSWLIGLGKAKASAATAKAGVEIEWDHGDDAKSKKGAADMIAGFGLAVPPASNVAPALTSRHIEGKAIDMQITWTGTIKVKKKDGVQESITFMPNVNQNSKLHIVGQSYSVRKLTTDAPHWSTDGH